MDKISFACMDRYYWILPSPSPVPYESFQQIDLHLTREKTLSLELETRKAEGKRLQLEKDL